ncbi:hypothetical protein ACET3Z_004825 [Daucus carota]
MKPAILQRIVKIGLGFLTVLLVLLALWLGILATEVYAIPDIFPPDIYIPTTIQIFWRNLGGRNLWESRDDRKWGHDKFFEEITTQERRREEAGRHLEDVSEPRKSSRRRT